MIRLIVLAFLMLAGTNAGAAEPIAATYRLTTRGADTSQHAQFLLLRSDDVVEVHDEYTGVIERWEREASGRLFYLRIFPDARKVIEFQPADLGSAKVTGDWDVVRTVTGTAVLDRLEPRGNRRMVGHRAAVFRGTIDGVSTEFNWLSELQLPARVERRAGHERQELRLTRLEQGEPAAMRFMTREQLRAYESIDFADLGDRLGDPFVDRVMDHGGLQLHTH